MNTLLDKMFIKRFCLPINVDINNYEKGVENIHNCICGDFNHASLFYKDEGHLKKVRIICFGFNKEGDIERNIPGIHAEQDAINKLPSLKNKKRLEAINLLVIRISGKNKIQSSKPCAKCIETMKLQPIKKGYKIQNIYYSNINGEIIKTNLNKLDNEEKHYTKYYRKQSQKIILNS